MNMGYSANSKKHYLIFIANLHYPNKNSLLKRQLLYFDKEVNQIFIVHL